MESAHDQSAKQHKDERTPKGEAPDQQETGEALSSHPLEQIDMNEHDEGTEELADQQQQTQRKEAGQ